jgi:hypothetical protein
LNEFVSRKHNPSTLLGFEKQARKTVSLLQLVNVPETNNKPDERTFKTTTRFPRNRPANKMTTVPGVMADLILGAFLTGLGPFLKTTSSAG